MAINPQDPFADLQQALDAARDLQGGLDKAQRRLTELAQAAEASSENVSQTGEALKRAADAFNRTTPGTQAAKDALDRWAEASKANKDALAENELITKEVTKAEKDLYAAFKKLSDAVDKEEKAFQKEAAREEKAAQKAIDAAARAADAQMLTGQDVKGAPGKAVGGAVALAGGGAAGMLGDLAGQMSQFVAALNPSAVEVFSQAMGDLNAVIGTALMPVFTILTTAVRQVANLLLPVAEELAPVFAQIAGVIMSVLQPAFQTLTGLIRLTIPPLQIFSDILSALAPLLVAYQTIQAAVIDVLADFMKSLLGPDYAEGMNEFKSAMQKLAGAAITTVGALARMSQTMFGFGDKLLDSLIKATEGGRQKKAEGLAAKQGTLTSFGGLDSQELVKAFSASGIAGEQDKTDNQWLKEANDNLKDIKAGIVSPEQWMDQLVDKIFNKLTHRLAVKIFGETLNRAAEVAMQNPGAAAIAIGGANIAFVRRIGLVD